MTQSVKTEKSNIKIALILFFIVFGMFGFGYATVPLYNVLCSRLGFNGKTGGPAANSAVIDNSRTITVQFLATNNADLPWKFYPIKTSIKVHPGENTKMAYFAENDSNKDMTVQAIPSVSPGIAAKYLKKTECFCFTQQYLAANKGMRMPVLFHLDPSIPSDVNTLTISYTMFDASAFAGKNGGTPGRID